MQNKPLEAGTTLSLTWPQLKEMASEFFRRLPDASEEEAEAGLKCLQLGYMGMQGSDLEHHQAGMLVQMASSKVAESELASFGIFR